MAITDESNGNGFYMPVAPAYGGNNSGFGGFGGDGGWWIILLFVLLGGWGGGMGGYGGMGGLYPWLNNSQNINGGFRDQMLNSGIDAIGAKIDGVNASVNSGVNAITAQLYNGTIADMERSFAVQSALQNCCCENRAATADLKYTLASEACATRATDTANTQAILDKLCALELDGVKAQLAAEQRENANLRSDLQYARGQASQIEQTAAIRAGQVAEVDALYNRLKNCPVGTFSVCNPNIYPGQSSCPCSGGFAN